MTPRATTLCLLVRSFTNYIRISSSSVHGTRAVGWAFALKGSVGFTRLGPSVVTVALMIAIGLATASLLVEARTKAPRRLVRRRIFRARG